MADVYSNCGCVNSGGSPAVRVVSGNDLTVEALLSVYDRESGVYKPLDLSEASDVSLRLVGTFSKVQGTWRKCMGKVWERLRREASKEPCVMAGDFNHTPATVADRLGKRVADAGGFTFRHNFTGSSGSVDHCVAFGLHGVSCRVVDDGFMMSDHLPLVIEIKDTV